jgi:hypothetical protein
MMDSTDAAIRRSIDDIGMGPSAGGQMRYSVLA